MTSPAQRLRAALIATDEALFAIHQELDAAREAFHTDRSTEALCRLNAANVKLQSLMREHKG